MVDLGCWSRWSLLRVGQNDGVVDGTYVGVITAKECPLINIGIGSSERGVLVPAAVVQGGGASSMATILH